MQPYSCRVVVLTKQNQALREDLAEHGRRFNALAVRNGELEKLLMWFVEWVVRRGVSAPCGITDRVAAEINEARDKIAAAEALLKGESK